MVIQSLLHLHQNSKSNKIAKILRILVSIVFLDRGDVKHDHSRKDILNRQARSGKVVDWIKIEISELLVGPELSDWRVQPLSLCPSLLCLLPPPAP